MDYWTLMTLYATICHFLYVPSGCITHMEIAREGRTLQISMGDYFRQVGCR